MLNFTCKEKRDALFAHICCQTFRESAARFYDPVIEPRTKQLMQLNLRDLDIWWNARNFPCYGEKKKLGRGRIVSITKMRVCDLTDADAVADGFKTKEDMVGWLLNAHPNWTLESEGARIIWRWIEC